MMLAKYVKEGKISFEVAMTRASKPDELERLVGAMPAMANSRN
jgi:twitching motility protein PilT